MSEKRLPRRQFLRFAALTTSSGVLAACAAPVANNPSANPAPTSAPASTSAPAPAATLAPASTSAPIATSAPVATSAPATATGNLTIMYTTEELSDESLKIFTDRNPELTVERVPNDETRLKAMIAGGTPPDVFQLGGGQMSAYLNQGILLKLNDYFAASSLLKLDDLAPANSFFKWDGKRLGSGDVYGMAKDWSPDYSFWINPDAFKEAGLAIPDDKQPITYAKLAEYAAALTKKSGDKYERIGMTYETYSLDAVMQFRLAEDGANLYSPDFKQVLIKDSPGAVEVLRYYYDLSQQGYTWTPLNPSPNGWNGKDFTLGLSGAASNGYWFSGLLRGSDDSPVHNKAIMLPAPTWGKLRYSPAYGPSGAVVAASSKNPDAAWKFFEFINAQEPATERATSGWGVPALTSLFSLMPQETDFDKQAYRVVQDEIANAAFVREINPYFASGSAFEATWKTNLELALRGEIDFDKLVETVDADMNQALQDGLSAAGV